jgi:hypothetical protein
MLSQVAFRHQPHIDGKKINLKSSAVLEKVFKLGHQGVSKKSIAKALGVSERSLHRYFQDESNIEFREAYAMGRAAGVIDVESALYINAVENNNVKAQIYFLERMAPEKWGTKNKNSKSQNVIIKICDSN